MDSTVTTLFSIFMFLLRISMPIIAFVIVSNCFVALREKRRGKQPLITLVNLQNMDSIPVLYWENTIGRSKNSDIIFADGTVSRNHAVLYRREEGWMIEDTSSHSGTVVNGKKIKRATCLHIGDQIEIGCTALSLQKADIRQRLMKNWFFDNSGGKKALSSLASMFLLTIFQILGFAQLMFSKMQPDFQYLVPMCSVIAIGWAFFFVSKLIFKRVSFELEIIALFLCSVGIITICSDSVKSAYVQMGAMVIGMCLYCFMIWFLQEPDIVMKWRLTISIASVGLLGINLLIGSTLNGSKNWIIIGPISIQPSEFVKISLIMVGTSTLIKLQTTKNMTEFIVFSAICIGALFLMGDFGTACVFFITFIIIAFMRSGDIRTIVFILVGAAFGAFIILQFKPYIADRFSVWRHAFDYVQTTGYQQAHVLSYSASGGLLGVGLGNGNLKDIFASTSDLVFGMICEEMGIIMAIVTVMALCSLAFYARALSSVSRTTLYSIGACAVGGMFVFQAALNIFGSTDILPLTGVTLPFVSLGGSSMVSVWGLLAFIKAADERTYSLIK